MDLSFLYKIKKFFTKKEKPFEIKDTGKYGNGCFATRDIKKGETITFFNGEVITFEETEKRIVTGDENRTDSFQVDLEMDMDLNEESRSFNHSCNPNAGFRGFSEMIALRDINRGEEITYDYSATVGPNIPKTLWEMPCFCKSNNCRKIIGNVLTIPKDQLDQYVEAGTLQDYIKKELEIIKKNNGILPKYKEIKPL